MAQINNVNVTPTSNFSNRATSNEKLTRLVSATYTQNGKNFFLEGAGASDASDLSGDYTVITENDGWYSNVISDASGNISPVTVVITCDSPVSLWGFRVVGHDLTNNYPVNYSLTFKRQGTVDKVINVTNANVVTQRHEFTELLTDVIEITLRITKISVPFAYAHIVNLYNLNYLRRTDNLKFKLTTETSYAADKKAPRSTDRLKLRVAQQSKQIVGLKRSDYGWVDNQNIPPNTVKYLRYSPNADGSNSTDYKQPDSKYVGIGFMPEEYLTYPNIFRGTADFKLDTNRVVGFQNLDNKWIIEPDPASTENLARCKVTGQTTIQIKSLYATRIHNVTPADVFTLSLQFKTTDFAVWDTHPDPSNFASRPFILEMYDATNLRVAWTDVRWNWAGNVITPNPPILNNTWYTLTRVIDLGTNPWTWLAGKSWNDVKSFSVRLALFHNGEVFYKHLKLSRGNLVGNWTPAPIDWLTNPSNFTWQEIKPSLGLRITESSKITNVHSRMKDHSRRIHGKVYITYFNPMLETLLSYNSSPMSNHSSYDQLMNAEMGDGTPNYATMYHNNLSGGFQVAGDDAEFGWISANVCDDQGYFYGTPGVMPSRDLPNLLPQAGTFNAFTLENGFIISEELFNGGQVLHYSYLLSNDHVTGCALKPTSRIPVILGHTYKLTFYVRFENWEDLSEFFRAGLTGRNAAGVSSDGEEIGIKDNLTSAANGVWTPMSVESTIYNIDTVNLEVWFMQVYLGEEDLSRFEIDISSVVVEDVTKENLLPNPDTFTDYDTNAPGFSIATEKFKGSDILHYSKIAAGSGWGSARLKESINIPAKLDREYRLRMWVRFTAWNQLPTYLTVSFDGCDENGDPMDGDNINIKNTLNSSRNNKWTEISLPMTFTDPTVVRLSTGINPGFDSGEEGLQTEIDFSRVVIEDISGIEDPTEDYYAGYPLEAEPRTTRMIFYSANTDGTNRTTTKQPDSKYVGIAYVPNEILESPNMFKNSDFNRGKADWSYSNAATGDVLTTMPNNWPKAFDGARMLSCVNTSNANGNIVQTIENLPVGTYTVSSYLFAPSTYQGSLTLAVWRSTSSGWVTVKAVSTSVRDKWVKVTVPVNITEVGNYVFSAGGGTRNTGTVGTIYTSHPKLEVGAVDTDWTPSLEDWLNNYNTLTWYSNKDTPTDTYKYIRYSTDPSGTNPVEYATSQTAYRGIAYMPKEIHEHPNLCSKINWAPIIGQNKSNQTHTRWSIDTTVMRPNTNYYFRVHYKIDATAENPANSKTQVQTETDYTSAFDVRTPTVSGEFVATRSNAWNTANLALLKNLYFRLDYVLATTTLTPISGIICDRVEDEWKPSKKDWLADKYNFVWEEIQPSIRWQKITPTFLEVSFSTRLLTDCYVIFDVNKGTYPVDFDIYIYEEIAPDPIKVEIRNFSGNRYTFVNDYPEVYKLRFEFLRMNKPLYPVTVTEIYVSSEVVYTDEDKLLGIDFLEELTFDDDVTTLGSVSANEVTISLDNMDKEFFYDNEQSLIRNQLRKNRRIEPWLGVEVLDGKVEWHQLGTYWSDQWDVPVESRSATVTGYDTLHVLNKLSYYNHTIMHDKSIAELIEGILIDAREQFSWISWKIDPELENIIIPTAWFENSSHAQALKRIASCGLLNIYCDRKNVINCRLRKYEQEQYQDVWKDSTNIISKNYPSMYKLLSNRINVGVTEVGVTPIQEILKVEEVIPVDHATTLEFAFNDVCFEIADIQIVKGASVTTEVTAYSWGIHVKVSGTGGISSITVTGRLIETTVKTIKSAQDNKRIQQDGLQQVTINHDFIQTSAYAQQLATDILEITSDDNYYVEVDYTGDIVDTLGYPIKFEGGISPSDRYIMSRNKLMYDGALQGEATLIT